MAERRFRAISAVRQPQVIVQKAPFVKGAASVPAEVRNADLPAVCCGCPIDAAPEACPQMRTQVVFASQRTHAKEQDDVDSAHASCSRLSELR